MQLHSFPFYKSKFDQFRFDPRLKESADWHLFSASNRFLPFSIKKPADGQLIDCVKVFNLADELVHLIEPEDLNYKMYSGGGFDFIFYYAALVEGMNLACGKYYIQIGEFFSEVFTVADVSKMLLIEWKNKNNIGEDLIYQNGFFQRLYLDTLILEPKYKIDQEGEEDGFETFIPTFTKLSKQLAIQSELLPEFLVDALALLPLHDQVSFGKYQETKAIEMDVDWLVNGVLGSVEIKFNEAEFAVAKICADPLVLVEVDQAGYVPKSWICNGEPDPSPYWQDTGVIECVKVEETVDDPEPVPEEPELHHFWVTSNGAIPQGTDVVTISLHRYYDTDAIEVFVAVRVNGESEFTLPLNMPLTMLEGQIDEIYNINVGKPVSSFEEVKIVAPIPAGYQLVNQ